MPGLQSPDVFSDYPFSECSQENYDAWLERHGMVPASLLRIEYASCRQLSTAWYIPKHQIARCILISLIMLLRSEVRIRIP